MANQESDEDSCPERPGEPKDLFAFPGRNLP